MSLGGREQESQETQTRFFGEKDRYGRLPQYLYQMTTRVQGSGLRVQDRQHLRFMEWSECSVQIQAGHTASHCSKDWKVDKHTAERLVSRSWAHGHEWKSRILIQSSCPHRWQKHVLIASCGPGMGILVNISRLFQKGPLSKQEAVIG